jgi:hypothetical protein
MTAGAILLMALGSNPPSAGPFCLSTYYRLESVDHALRSRAQQPANRWSDIEIFFSGTRGGNVDRLAEASGLASSADLNCHFVICNGVGAGDGEIQTTEKWQMQATAYTGPASDHLIRICLIGDGVSAVATDYQLKRLEMLLETLCRRFAISADSVHLPADFQ